MKLRGIVEVVDFLTSMLWMGSSYWSWYWANEPRYMATIMYHNLHIIQLEHLASVSGSEVIGSYARKFERYVANPFNRLRSAASVFKSKVSK